MNLLDFILLAVVAVTVFFAAKKGFVLALIEFISGLLAIALSYAVAPAVSGSVYNSFLKVKVTQALSQQFPTLAAGKPLSISISDITGILPKSVAFLFENIGLSDSKLELPTVSKYLSIEQLEQNLAAPIIKAVVTVIAFVAIAILLTIVLRIVARLLNKLVKVTPLKSMNTLLGAVFGGVKGLLHAGVLAVLLSIIGSVTAPSAFATFVENSKLCELVLKIF